MYSSVMIYVFLKPEVLLCFWCYNLLLTYRYLNLQWSAPLRPIQSKQYYYWLVIMCVFKASSSKQCCMQSVFAREYSYIGTLHTLNCFNIDPSVINERQFQCCGLTPKAFHIQDWMVWHLIHLGRWKCFIARKLNNGSNGAFRKYSDPFTCLTICYVAVLC